MRSLLFFTCLFTATFAQAQRPLLIADGQALARAEGIKGDKLVIQALKDKGYTSEQIEMMSWYGQERLRPVSLRDSVAKVDLPYLIHLKAFEIATLGSELAGRVVVMIPAQENLHMPLELRPFADLFVVLPAKAVANGKPVAMIPAITNGPDWKGRQRIKITDPKAIYATMDLKTYKPAQQVLREHLAPREIQHVELRSNEQYWPNTMNTLEKRKKLIKKFKKYKAFELVRFEDKVVLVVPAMLNQRMPKALRPAADIYLVYGQDAVQAVNK